MTSSLGATSSRNTPPTVEDPYQAHFKDSDFSKLSDTIKRVTWFIKVNNGGTESYGSGFAIKLSDSMIVLMSCAHIMNEKSSIMVRNIDDKEFILEAEILEIKPSWDLSLLVVKGINSMYAAEFAEDGAISSGQTLVHAGHPYRLVYSVFAGRAVYPCVNNCLQLSADDLCGNYVSSSLKSTPEYRIIGHILNKDFYYSSKYGRDPVFVESKTLWAHIPIIQCAGICNGSGCSGGPVFDTQGYVVGMMIGKFHGCQIATHVTLLKEFVRMNSTAN